MDGLDLIKTFREVAFRRSFSRAAISLGMSKATVSRYVAELETRSGVRLLNRSTRSLSLTDAGQVLLERSTELVAMAESTLNDLQAHGSHPQGRLRMSAPHGLIAGWLSDVIAEFIKRYPEVYVSLVFTNDNLDLIEEGIDIHLTGGRIDDMNLIVRRLVQFDMVVCASPAYWAQRGMPQVPEDMGKHEVLSYSSMPTTHLPFETDGKPHDVAVHSRMEANDAVALIELALRGVGVAYVPEPLAQSHLERGALVPVLRDHMPHEHWLYAAYSQRRHNSAAMRAMLDFLEQSMGPDGDNPVLPPLPASTRVQPPACALSKVQDVAKATAAAARTGTR
ncbi:LysR family transcriptional regulator [Variovorax sp. J22G73]|jgi:DNA-binding transcriptional LysR family regulator|uniref:LysR family transcriptional regulator n=1 Tax=unclassified Variovorax TaxID=663243 RepID=UPI002575A4E8|nr:MULTISPECIES: LysR family transcriptional regulator [unclassified Variovorax]MDM0005600.1 LysR family transcriptional regulator [Variovorax sp. J22R203]MDM0099627.1 LysR family transcriptional regulator [Variovorax sp. J22G73]